MCSHHAPTRRLFFALWPDDALRAELVKRLRSIPRRRGKPVAVENLHITLAFLGSVDESMYRCVQFQASKIKTESFTMALSRLGFFPRPKVMWLGPQSCPPPLQCLVQVLNSNLSLCGHVPESRPFHAHLTLFRKALPVKSDVRIAPVQWSIDGFCLVESKTHSCGVEYCVLRHYSLLS